MDNLNTWELQQACKARGMRAYGVSDERMRSQLEQWLELSLDEKIPPSLLLLSRALYIPENLPQIDQLKATISTLPESVVSKMSIFLDLFKLVIDLSNRQVFWKYGGGVI